MKGKLVTILPTFLRIKNHRRRESMIIWSQRWNVSLLWALHEFNQKYTKPSWFCLSKMTNSESCIDEHMFSENPNIMKCQFIIASTNFIILILCMALQILYIKECSVHKSFLCQHIFNGVIWEETMVGSSLGYSGDIKAATFRSRSSIGALLFHFWRLIGW